MEMALMIDYTNVRTTKSKLVNIAFLVPTDKFFFPPLFLLFLQRSRYSDYVMDGRRIVIQFLLWAREFSLVRRVQTDCAAHSTSYSLNIKAVSPQVKGPACGTHHRSPASGVVSTWS